MSKEEIVNEVMGSFKMTVDTKGLKKLEKYIDNLEQENKQLKDRINKTSDLLKLLHYQFPDYDDMHKRIEEIEKILKEDNKE